MSSHYKNIARVLKAHGSKGEVIVAELRGLPFLVEPGMRVALTPPALDRDRFVRVESVVDGGDRYIVCFSCAHSIGEAESLAGCYVLADSDDLQLDSFDVTYDDLLDRSVIDVRFGGLGTIVEIMETPANDVWVIAGGAYGEVLVPVVEEVVLDIPEAGPIRVKVMDGLINS